jgi:type II secretory pathway component PulK
MTRPRPLNIRRGFATFLVLWVLAVGTVAVAAVQASAFRQAAAGREALARVRASWAARAGVEAMIARLAWDTENPDPNNAFRELDDMAAAAAGDLDGARYLVAHSVRGRPGLYLGCADAHAKLNVSAMDAQGLMRLEYMTEDVAAAILGWTRSEDLTSATANAEASYYAGLPHPYEPRHAPLRSIAELELVYNARPEFVRGEDWNLNGVIDPNEDDGEASWPPDDANGKLDAEWSGVLTAASRDGGFGVSGKPRIVLRGAKPGELTGRLRLSERQAKVVATYASYPRSAMGDFVKTDLKSLQSETSNKAIDSKADPLTREQLSLLLNETTMDDTGEPRPGRLNINTCPAEVLDYVPGLSPAAADAIIAERAARHNGFTSVAQLLDVQGLKRAQVATLVDVVDVRSNVYVAACRGRDEATGIEVEMIATLDRTRLPVVITELRTR